MGYTLDQAAALLHIGRNTLTKELRKKGVFDTTNKPQGRYSGAGLFVVAHKQFIHPTKGAQMYHRTLVTPKGLQVLEKILRTDSPKTLH